MTAFFLVAVQVSTIAYLAGVTYAILRKRKEELRAAAARPDGRLDRARL